jgi:hypothetical protein
MRCVVRVSATSEIAPALERQYVDELGTDGRRCVVRVVNSWRTGESVRYKEESA